MTKIFTTDITVTSEAFNTVNESMILIEGVTVVSTLGTAFIANGSSIRFIVNGTVVAAGIGVAMGDQSGLGNFLTVGHNGSITSADIGGVMLFNAGSRVNNFGEITSDYAGIWVSANAGQPINIVNAGMISGLEEAIFDSFSAQIIVTNTGTLMGGAQGAFVSDGNSSSISVIHNRGLIIGDVILSLGNDLYDGRGGTVEGTVSGGGDDDTFIAGLSAETFDGGEGIDLLDFSRTVGVVASLDNTVTGTRNAENDIYINIENITGSRTGKDNLTGSDAANLMQGQGGADILSGGSGRDTLVGGTGKDVLTGGLGRDVFVFRSLAEAGDKITDFLGGGSGDTISISADAFGGGMSPGALNHLEFQSSAGTLAQTADIRFIFKTTDTTLWYDSNGSAAGGLTLVADLQANAVLTFADILLT